jgi:surface polysaccharide O-acyltransferase-like enzyme
MIKKLLALNGIAILGAVFYHASGWGFISLFWWTDSYLPVTVPNFDQLGSVSYYALRFIEQIIILAIPSFLFVSGYFIVFASGKKPSPNWKWVFTRLSFLIIPYLIWSIIILLFNAFFGEKYSIQKIINILLTGKAVEAFYFIPLIVQLYLLSPLLTRYAKNNPKLLLLGAFFLQALVRFAQFASMINLDYFAKDLLSNITPAWIFPGNIFWFILGITAGYHLKSIQSSLIKWRWVFFSFFILLIPIGMIEWESLLRISGREWFPPRETFIDNLYAFSFLVTYFTFSLNKLSKSKWLNFLGSKSFGIYLSHTLFLTVIAKSCYHYFPMIFTQQWIYQPLLISVGILGPLILMELFKRTPLMKIYGYVFG